MTTMTTAAGMTMVVAAGVAGAATIAMMCRASSGAFAPVPPLFANDLRPFRCLHAHQMRWWQRA